MTNSCGSVILYFDLQMVSVSPVLGKYVNTNFVSKGDVLEWGYGEMEIDRDSNMWHWVSTDMQQISPSAETRNANSHKSSNSPYMSIASQAS